MQDDADMTVLDPRYLELFLGLSEVLVDRGTLERWLGRAYFATLVAGALPEGTATDAADRLRAFLGAEPQLTDPSGVALDATLAQLAAPPGYQPPYAIADIAWTLHEFAAIVERHPPDLQHEVRQHILIAPANPRGAVVARCMLSLWYVAALIDLTPPPPFPGRIPTVPYGFVTKVAPIQTYAAAIAWQAIGGNPPGVAGPYFGNWSYPPPQPVRSPEEDP